ncbi:hypothetical protein GCM10011494_28780 [Novosphingobium endophyticum]|uniref:DUF4167 domain-containing protein n=1 Tax=Novosphingobium endophyticum TaxID=1955250 RepID=A0A916X6F2_9SPHN|nr:DUF4167 domain-containing protein [Novosphingobium endophyticum]GGC08345.1 hypothetical protein GCM10011494_28780 [Novosphingobium endophyticum]
MNNNRGNNRRRGRGGNRQQGGQQTNRIDSRARGNAPQMLEKYKKLAHDAHLNGDRVQEEYYLQFADHYFRVIADQKQRQEEARQPRRDDRSQDDRSQDYGDDASSDEDTYGEAARSYQDRAYQDRAYQDRAYQDRAYQDRSQQDRSQQDRSQQDREPRGERSPRAVAQEQREPAETGDESGSQDERPTYEPTENPFLRDNRGARGGLKQRRPRRGREDGEETGGSENAAGKQEADKEASSGGFDPETLPPSISTGAEEKPKRRTRAKPKAADAPAGEEGEEKPKRRRTRKAGPSTDGTDGSGGTLETVD